MISIDLDTMLRLARDLRQRGRISIQSVSTAIIRVAGYDLNARILAVPGLKVEHYDRLLKLLTVHDATCIDGYAEGLRGEYLVTRVISTNSVTVLGSNLENQL